VWEEVTISPDDNASPIGKDASTEFENPLDDNWGSSELHSRWKFIRKRYVDGMLSDWKIFYPTSTRSLQSQCDDFTTYENPLLPIEVQRDEWFKAKAVNIKKIDNTLLYTVHVYEDFWNGSINLSKVKSEDVIETWLYTYDCITNTPKVEFQLSTMYDYSKFIEEDPNKGLLYWPIIWISKRYYYSLDNNWIIRVHDVGSFWKQKINIKDLPQWDVFIEEMAYQTGKSKDILEFNGIWSRNISVNQDDEILLTFLHKPLPVPKNSPHEAMWYWEYYQWKINIYRE
jgi:hypothetical protein